MLQVLLTFFGGLVVATIICWLFWTFFKLVRRPEWGPCLAFVASLVLLHDRIGASFFYQMIILFSAIYAAGCSWEGGVWRARRAAQPTISTPSA
jgi:hypothetical protein